MWTLHACYLICMDFYSISYTADLNAHRSWRFIHCTQWFLPFIGFYYTCRNLNIYIPEVSQPQPLAIDQVVGYNHWLHIFSTDTDTLDTQRVMERDRVPVWCLLDLALVAGLLSKCYSAEGEGVLREIETEDPLQTQVIISMELIHSQAFHVCCS